MLIIHGTLVILEKENRIIPDGALLVRNGLISDLGASGDLEALYPSEDRLDASGKLILPGSICSHTHFYGAFARGMEIPGGPPRSFLQILDRLWWRLDKALDYDDIRLSALVCLADAIRHGTTTLIDHHASPHAIPYSLDAIAEAVQQAGVRACLCYEVSDRDGPEVAQAGIEENERFILSNRGKSEFIAGTFGLHASFTLSDETLARAVEAAGSMGVGFHLHMAEDMADVRDSLKRSGLRVVERMEKAGILGPKTIAAHCVHVDDAEIDILQRTGTHVVHSPRSNMNNAVGLARVSTMLRHGVPVGLGNDGFSNNMFVEMNITYLLHKSARGDPTVVGADQVIRMAYNHNAAIAGQFFTRPLGQLAVGAYADLILLDYYPPTPLTGGNFPWHVIFGLDGSHVNTTIVAGKVLMREHHLLTLDEAEIHAEARRLAARLWDRI